MNQQQKKTLTILTLALIIGMATLPVLVEAKNSKELLKEQLKHKSKGSSKPIPRNGFIVKQNLGKKVTMYREYIPLDVEEIANGLPIDPNLIEELPDGLYYSVNVYAYETKDSVILIDAGHEILVKKLYAEIKSEYKKKPITVLLTHGHADHAGGGSYLQAKGATIYAHPYELQTIMYGFESPDVPDAFKYTGYQAIPYPMESYPNEFMGFEIRYTPGHTMGSVTLYHSKLNALFTGDLFVTLGESETDSDFTTQLVYLTLDSHAEYPMLLMAQEASINSLDTNVKVLYTRHYGPYSGKKINAVIYATLNAIADALE